MTFQPLFRIQPAALAVLVAFATVAFAGCGGGGGGTGLGCASGGYGGGGNCSGNPVPSPTPTVNPTAQTVGILLTGESPVTVPTYGAVLGYANGTPSAPNGSNVVNLTANQAVQFANDEASVGGVEHTASSLGNWSGSYPAAGPTNAQQSASPSGTVISAAGFSSGDLMPGQVSPVYNSGASGGIYVFGCFFHYNSNNMRTVVIVM